MSYEKLELLIDGNWRQGSSSKTEPVINPANNETLGVNYLMQQVTTSMKH